jgi:hypoxanthine phosphoribosyltransferase
VKILFERSQIREKVVQLADEISSDYNNQTDFIGLIVLNGAMRFGTELLEEVSASCLIDTVAIESYQGTSQNLPILTKKPKNEIAGFEVLVIEDIVDTGNTMQFLIDWLKEHGAKSVRICSLLSKPEARQVEVPIHYLGWEIPKEYFVYGCGMDKKEKGRTQGGIWY